MATLTKQAMKNSFWHRLLDLLAPRLCVVCGRRLSLTEKVLCVSCNMHLPRTGFQYQPADNIMARLFWGIIPVERAAALFYYAAGSKPANILYDLKYHDHPEIGREMGRLIGCEMGEAGFFEGIDLLVPVPLARSRQRRRGYNQSLELAKGISRMTGVPVAGQVVRRTVFKQSQTRMQRRERQENVEGVFVLTDAAAIRDKHILLIDDVVTTGATMMACGRELLRAGGVRLSLLSLGFTSIFAQGDVYDAAHGYDSHSFAT